jgi:transcriptional regulator with XRE-family HTH domain
VDGDVGSQLRALRAASGRTVASVAAEAGLSVPYIANLENGRGNPTTTALSRLASALGRQLVITLAPAGQEPQPLAGVQAPLVRLSRTGRFRATTARLAEELGADQRALAGELVTALSSVAAVVDRDLAEADWWRLIDAILLIAACPADTGDSSGTAGP